MNIENVFNFKIITKNQLSDFYNKSDDKTFLQDYLYGDFREKIGETIFLFGIFNKDKLIGTSLIQKIKTSLKTFLHCPHGPINTKLEKKEAILFWNEFLKFYKDLGKKEKCDFVRISPLLESSNTIQSINIFKKQKFRNAPIHLVNPERTWILDISQSEENLLKNMKKSTRYEVRRIKKMGIDVKMGNKKEDLDIFWELHTETVKRQKFIPFPKKNTEIELDVYKENCQIFSAKLNNKFMSSSVILFDNNSAYYHQGASLYSKAPVSYATIWEAILEAKNRGCKNFNFWGVVGDNEKSHPWYGLSRFKKGFGGNEYLYIHCQDFPITWKYWLNFILEKYRKWKKRY